MKFALFALLFAFNAMAAVTPAEMREIRARAYKVMYKLGGEAQLNAEITSVQIVDELGSRVTVEFVYEEMFYGEKTCTFIYDLNTRKEVPRSALCRP